MQFFCRIKVKLQAVKVKIVSYEEKIKNATFDIAEKNLQQEGEKFSEQASKKIIKYSDATIEKSYKISCEFAKGTLPSKFSKKVEIQLKNYTNALKEKNQNDIEKETVALVNSSITAIISVAKDEKNFEEASREIFLQGKGAVKKVVIENAKDVAMQEGKNFLAKNGVKIFQSDAKANPALNAVALGFIVQDSLLKFNKNVQAGFELIEQGTFSNDVEVIAQGLDKILKNFNGEVAFSNCEDFRKNFRQKKIVLKSA